MLYCTCFALSMPLILITRKKIILITGGQRSGTSQYAESMALSLSDNPVYIATAHVWDEEFKERVEKHQQRRGPQWENIEEERNLGSIYIYNKVALIDCLTLWATNFFFAESSEDCIPDVDKCLEEIKAEFDKFTNQDATFIFVTNEIGNGGVSGNAIQRRFTDLLGWLNQYVAKKADEVYLTVCGIPVKIK